jgi:hypothetical protein
MYRGDRFVVYVVQFWLCTAPIASNRSNRKFNFLASSLFDRVDWRKQSQCISIWSSAIRWQWAAIGIAANSFFPEFGSSGNTAITVADTAGRASRASRFFSQ